MKTATLRSLLKNDVRLIARDPMLVVLAVVILSMGVGMRFALPVLDTAFADAGVMPSSPGGMRFADTFPAFVVFITLWQGANIPGIIFGFLLLDEKDDNTLLAMRVTPLPFRSYAGYRVGLSSSIAFVTIVYLGVVAGQATLPLPKLLLCAIGATLTTPLAVLFFAIFAANKVQGLALVKFVGIAGLTVLLGFFVPEPWQWLLGVFPPFLVAKSYWMALDGHALFWVPLLFGVVFQLALLRWLLQRFQALSTR